jgi:hypothetical protein
MADVYERRISAEEAREGYLFVEKARLSFFPPRGQPFSLSRDGAAGSAAVESYACSCRGPEKPHEHYLIRLDGLVQGQRVRVSRLAPGRYGIVVLS